MDNRRVLVTGGSGFIGSHLVRRLLADGYHVGITVRVDHDRDNWRLKDVWSQLHVLELDIRNRASVRQIRQFDPNVVFHLAAYHHVGRSWSQVEECFDVNAKGSANVIDAALSCNAHLIYMSSSEIYGFQEEAPWHEDLTPAPQSPYAVTKYTGELYACMAARNSAPHRVNIARPFNVFGPGQSDRAVIGEFIKKALQNETIYMTEGTQTREFNYVDNIIDGLMLLWQKNPGIGPWNIACGEDIAIRYLVKHIISMCNSSSEVVPSLPTRPNEIWEMRADSSRFRDATGWKPAVSFTEGLQRTIEWYKAQLQNSTQKT